MVGHVVRMPGHLINTVNHMLGLKESETKKDNVNEDITKDLELERRTELDK